MGKLNKLLQGGFSVALENIPFAGKVFEVLHEMEDEKRFDTLEKESTQHSRNLKQLLKSIESIETRLDDLTQPIRQLKEYDQAHDFVMLPKLLHNDPAFQSFWLNPQEFGGSRQILAQATKQDNCFSFLMNDMYGEKWVYHIPIFTFGLLLQNKSLKGESTPKALGYDQFSQTHWVTEDSQQLLSDTPPPDRQPQISQSSPVYQQTSSAYQLREYAPQPQLIDKIRELVADFLAIDIDDLRGDIPLSELGADDLDIVEIVMDLEDKLDISIPDEDIDKALLPTIEELVSIVEKAS